MNTSGMTCVQRCERCGAEFDDQDLLRKCPACGGLLETQYGGTPPVDELRRRFDARACARTGVDSSGVWRYREIVFPGAADEWIVSHPEGNTPLLRRDVVGRWAGVPRLLMKHEGHNPTGSFKDRGMTVAMTQARLGRATAVACASTGNTSASLGAYAAQAGLRALVFVPAGQVALGKLTQTLAYGATTLLVRGDFDACLDLARAAGDRLGVHLLNSVNPFRIAGQKTIAFELLHQLGWSVPDWIALPAGNLGNTAAIGKALLEARELGLIDRLPRLLAVQAAGAAPFAEAFRHDFRERRSVRAETVATAIRIGDPASWDRAVRVIRETNGVVAAVTDDEILGAKAVIDAAGVGCEPASAASVAGVRKLAAEGVIPNDADVVAILTGHVLKDPGILVRFHRETEPPPPGANRPVEIDARLEQVERVLSQVER